MANVMCVPRYIILDIFSQPPYSVRGQMGLLCVKEQLQEEILLMKNVLPRTRQYLENPVLPSVTPRLHDASTRTWVAYRHWSHNATRSSPHCRSPGSTLMSELETIIIVYLHLLLQIRQFPVKCKCCNYSHSEFHQQYTIGHALRLLMGHIPNLLMRCPHSRI